MCCFVAQPPRNGELEGQQIRGLVRRASGGESSRSGLGTVNSKLALGLLTGCCLVWFVLVCFVLFGLVCLFFLVGLFVTSVLEQGNYTVAS